MAKIDDELKYNAAVMSDKANTEEKRWRAAKGLSEDLTRMANAKRAATRKRAECPAEPRANARYRKFRDKSLGKLGSASKARKLVIAD
jgi:hypothetical protein